VVRTRFYAPFKPARPDCIVATPAAATPSDVSIDEAKLMAQPAVVGRGHKVAPHRPMKRGRKRHRDMVDLKLLGVRYPEIGRLLGYPQPTDLGSGPPQAAGPLALFERRSRSQLVDSSSKQCAALKRGGNRMPPI